MLIYSIVLIKIIFTCPQVQVNVPLEEGTYLYTALQVSILYKIIIIKFINAIY